MNRVEALELVKMNIKNQNIVRHMIAVGAIMRVLAENLGEDNATWELTGLVHDIDYEKTVQNFEKHGIMSEDILKDKVPEEIIKAIKAHNYEYTGVKPETRLEKGLIASDAVSGLIIACALVMPSKKVKDVDVKTISKKFKDKDFARGADRQRIIICEEIGIPKEKFFEISLKGIQNVSQELSI
ncbi:HDIG domain-containing protein [Candidatus Bathyarchaeota archaeon]|nr:HDIG domain-containing protein [Candidatus Bathyarchaeota archaeon]